MGGGGDVRIMGPKNGDPRYIIFGFRIYNFLNGGRGVLVEPSLMQTCCFRLMVEGVII